MTIKGLFEDLMKRVAELLARKLTGKISVDINISQGGISGYDFGFKEKVR